MIFCLERSHEILLFAFTRINGSIGPDLHLYSIRSAKFHWRRALGNQSCSSLLPPRNQQGSISKLLRPVFDNLKNISNTKDNVSSGYPNTEKRVENTTRSGVFLTKFEVFGYPDETLSRVVDRSDSNECYKQLL